jgi:hypothetical protein
VGGALTFRTPSLLKGCSKHRSPVNVQLLEGSAASSFWELGVGEEEEGGNDEDEDEDDEEED